MSEPFIVTEASTWIARGRTPEHAEMLAQAWRDFPDLPASAPVEDRMARTRERVAAMRPVTEAIRAQTAREHEAKNFAFMTAKIASGDHRAADLAIIRGRDTYGYAWMAAVRYSEGWHAAQAGWTYRRVEDNLVAYEQGFADGGGNPADVFDAARRSLIAPVDQGSSDTVQSVPKSRPGPSSWPKPSDAHRPATWPRRLLIIAEQPASSLALLATVPDAARSSIIVLTSSRGFIALDALEPGEGEDLSAARAAALVADRHQREQLAALIAGRDIEDILVAADGDYLRVIDAHARALPLCRAMERTRNTALQQRQHLRLWLGRGVAPGENVGAGHIRWGKRAKGLSAVSASSSRARRHH
ncbi:hypothetical protein [Novosphingobium sp. 9U]|uniref:hypothetical protein n=1 Tax=Novosphingobium sp. 9U TaxID=2653158 RepID=UPI0012F4738F|nr:hypothetical protein [Novosphingobium sp. 9U]VWX51046.1 conserved hypothetical protein [Novosphingobium sp. 9U]